jgi:site-specific recombinase XerC
VVGKGTKVVLIPLPPAVGRAVDQAVAGRTSGPILRHSRGRRMDRHTATRRLQHLADATGFAMPHLHPRMLCHTYVTTMLDAGVDLRDVQIGRPPRRPANHDAVRPRPQEPRPPRQLHPGGIHGGRNLTI